MKNQSTQELIFNTLDETRSLTTHELAIECALSEPSVRYHLRKLLQLGLIQEFVNLDPGLKAGRKAPAYRRISLESNRNTEQLCSILIRLLCNRTEMETNELVLSVAEQILSDEKNGHHDKQMSLREMMDWLNRHHYAASWEAGKLGPIVRFSNCPFSKVRSGNDLLCSIDEQILRLMNGQPWVLVHPMNWETLTGTCHFVVKPASYR